VISVPPGGAADRAGIRPGDQIVAVGGHAISSACAAASRRSSAWSGAASVASCRIAPVRPIAWTSSGASRSRVSGS
jgi:predicted metalloprotease with PDZ domain